MAQYLPSGIEGLKQSYKWGKGESSVMKGLQTWLSINANVTLWLQILPVILGWQKKSYLHCDHRKCIFEWMKPCINELKPASPGGDWGGPFRSFVQAACYKPLLGSVWQCSLRTVVSIALFRQRKPIESEAFIYNSSLWLHSLKDMKETRKESRS